VEDVAKIYIKEVFIKYRALNKIILDRDLRFIVVFKEVFCYGMGAVAIKRMYLRSLQDVA